MGKTYDFSGWATKANLKCSDGRTIMRDAFKDNNGETVPLVWNHQHNSVDNCLGHALLENRPEGVYAYCTFNDTESGKTAKLLVEHGDITGLSIMANQLKEKASNVFHGCIREVSLVLAGANPGAYIENVTMSHGEDSEDEAIIYTGENITLCHSDDKKDENDSSKKEEEPKVADKEKTIGEIFDTLNEVQKNACYAIIGQALEEAGVDVDDDDDNENQNGGESMKHNVFDGDAMNMEEDVLTHSQMETIISDGKRFGSLKESFLAHADEYGITNIDYLFPDAQKVDNQPQFIQRDMTWVQKVMNGVHHTPFSRIKSVFADITEDEARAKGYIKGKLKKEEVFSLLKRTTTPTTIYKKQKLDRDDVIDITDFDVVAWLKSEMRTMLDEEIARAILIGDGRLASSDDKINESNIRPIAKDDDLYTIKYSVDVYNGATENRVFDAKVFIDGVIKSRKQYKGSGNPSLFTTEDVVTECLLLEDEIGHKLYRTIEELATALRVKEIVTVEVMEGSEIFGVLVNLADYNVGADKGGAINMFDDFDIDYNQQKYLIETRCSGALIKPYSAIVYSAPLV